MRKITLVTELLVPEKALNKEIINEATRLLDSGGSNTKIFTVEDAEVHEGSILETIMTREEAYTKIHDAKKDSYEDGKHYAITHILNCMDEQSDKLFKLEQESE